MDMSHSRRAQEQHGNNEQQRGGFPEAIGGFGFLKV
jgi:hypothetical protein